MDARPRTVDRDQLKKAMTDVLVAIRRAFADVPRPEQFTDCRHRADRAEHEETLRAHTPDTISLEQVGNPGWDPICFVTIEGFKYFMPGLARLALARGYIAEFLFQLNDDRIAGFTIEQRHATRHLLEFIRDEMPDEVERWMAEEELKNRIEALILPENEPDSPQDQG
jgi:hypothetical protein